MERTNDMAYFEIAYKYIDELKKLPNDEVGAMVEALYKYVWHEENNFTSENADAQALFEKLKADCDKQIAEYKASMVQ